MRDQIIDFYSDKETQFSITSFLERVRKMFEHPKVAQDVHSIKSRIKAPSHLSEKIDRKGKEICPANLFDKVTDLAGIRILHLRSDQISSIHSLIKEQVEEGELILHEEPKAYTWDPEAKTLFASLGINTEVKESFYTSVHYVVRANTKPNALSCEIQVRTLFEEVWGEMDHLINYPEKSKSLACREQLKVLAKLVSTGSRLVDSICISNGEHRKSYERAI